MIVSRMWDEEGNEIVRIIGHGRLMMDAETGELSIED